MTRNLRISLPILFVVALMLAFIPPNHSLVGYWTITYKSGNKTHIHLRSNGTFRTEIPSENFVVEGKYRLSNNIFSVNDTSCNGAYWGKYKITFHGNDSIYSEVIEDTCLGRRNSADKATLVRDKK